MAIDGFFIKHLTKELNNNILNYRLEKIFQVDKDIFMFQFFYRKDRKRLIFKLSSPNSSVFLTNKNNLETNYDSNFLKILKKEFEGSILNNIKQYLDDRVIIFKFNKFDFLEGNIETSLILELMGRHNNLIIVRNNVIIDAYNKRFSENSRSILPNLKFEFFPSNKKRLEKINFDELTDNNYLSKSYMGISPLLSNYVYYTKTNFLKKSLKPTLNNDDNKFYWFDLFDDNINKSYFNSLSELLDNLVFVPKINNKKHLKFINNELDKLTRRKINLEKSIEIANSNLINKEKADLIYASSGTYNLNKNYSEIKTYNNKVIKLDSKLTLNENAQKLYKSYQKAKRTLEVAKKQKEEINLLEKTFKEFQVYISYSNIDDLYILEDELNKYGFNAKRKKNNKRKSIKDSILTLKYKNCFIYVGKNNTQNDYVTNILAKPNDYWLHVENAPGSHVLIKGDVDDDIIFLAANLAILYSDFRYSNKAFVNVTQKKYLKTIKGLPRYNVSLTNYETLNINVDKKLVEKVFIANNLNYN